MAAWPRPYVHPGRQGASIGAALKPRPCPFIVHDEILFDNEHHTRSPTNPRVAWKRHYQTVRSCASEDFLNPFQHAQGAFRSVDINTKQEELAAFERSDVTAFRPRASLGNRWSH